MKWRSKHGCPGTIALILKVVTKKDRFPKNAPNCLVALVEMTYAPGARPGRRVENRGEQVISRQA